MDGFWVVQGLVFLYFYLCIIFFVCMRRNWLGKKRFSANNVLGAQADPISMSRALEWGL